MDPDHPLDAIRHTAEHERDAYAGSADRPLGGYIALAAVFGTGLAGLVAGVRAGRRPLPQPSPLDLLLLAGATHQASRLLAKDPVTSPLRAPFTRYRGTSGPAELREDVRGSGLRHAVGELVTCPYCLGPWTATALAAGLVTAPRATRLAAAALTAVAGADLLHLLRGRMQQSG
ncbi:DUF1360 domain-containing protein [Peterkaempfera griseoplana]|uniref:DUF1360 domain-containing protein n=1 Tax=Peterkaempfera griseoplana TaxID=66896 RepID=UPI0006E31420|nr:DUF1360 domain-containing protein [Peterkaempfera griseoplana]